MLRAERAIKCWFVPQATCDILGYISRKWSPKNVWGKKAVWGQLSPVPPLSYTCLNGGTEWIRRVREAVVGYRFTLPSLGFRICYAIVFVSAGIFNRRHSLRVKVELETVNEDFQSVLRALPLIYCSSAYGIRRDRCPIWSQPTDSHANDCVLHQTDRSTLWTIKKVAEHLWS